MNDPFDLERFVRAQDQGNMYERALSELRRGQKTTHWMWFVFPQIRGLGHSEAAQTYGIGSLKEARAYLAHSVLGPRLAECAQALLGLRGRTAVEVLGGTDAMKLRSSMTLFARAAPDASVFEQVLRTYFDGSFDELTDRLLAAQ